ncbi:MAG: HK97-gp10 family putative phage morphogenesis protein [Planctomycetota bacterium]
MSMTIQNLDRMYLLLAELPDKSAPKAARAGLGAGATPIAREARARVNVESGILKRSMGRRTKTHRNGVVVTNVGPRRGVSTEFEGQRRIPAHYGHLVNNGHRNRDGSFTEGSHFMDQAFESKRDEAESIVINKMIEKLTADAHRLGRRV